MPFGNVDRVLSYSQERGIHKGSGLPDWVKDAIKESHGSQEQDASHAFYRHLTMAGADMLENYGCVTEAIDVWRLPDDEGWLVAHFDGEDCDAFFYFDKLTHYMDFQVYWIVPMAKKIMMEEQYVVWKNEMEKAAVDKPCLH